MGFFNRIFKRKSEYTRIRELGGYNAIFSSFGADIYANELIRACIRTLASYTSKATPKVLRDGKIVDKRLQRLLEYRPNIYMNGKDFLYKIRTQLEIYNTVFIYIQRDDKGNCQGLYPLPNATYEAVTHGDEIFIKFQFAGGVRYYAWEDLAVLRKDYNKSNFFGDNNDAILKSINVLETANQGISNAIKSTANLRGIIKSTKAILSPEDKKKARDAFMEDYMTNFGSSGIGYMDASEDFKEVKMEPTIADSKTLEELRLNIYRYFGVSEEAILSKLTPDEYDALYEAEIEPVLIAFGYELTNKIFTQRERDFNNVIVYESQKLQYASANVKLRMVSLIDRGVLSINEYRAILNMSPVEGGDKRLVRKEYADIDNLDEIQGIEEGETDEKETD